jgi:recombination protein RecT
VPYGKTCTFVPGWKGLVDIANRSGRATVWTGAVFQGDDFDYALGDSPFVRHRPGDEDDPAKMTHVYAIGRVNGSDHPVIEVWTIRKIWKHRDQYNKVGGSHYSFRDQEMYARKIPLLQVLKYMPASIELNNAMTISHAAEEGRGAVIEGNFVTIDDPVDDGGQDRREEKPTRATCSPEKFDQNREMWQKMIETGKKTVNDLIATIQTKDLLTDEQRMEIASWSLNTQGA